MDNAKTSLQMNPFDKLCPTPAGLLGLVLLFAFRIPPFNQEYMLRWLIYCGFIVAMSVSFDLTVGYISIVNFGYVAVAGFGGYTSALLGINLGISPWFAMLIGR